MLNEGGLRQRRGGGGLTSEPKEDFFNKPIFKKISTVDMYPKPKEDFRSEQTYVGGLLSFGAILIIVMLICWEVFAYTVGLGCISNELSVDSGVNDVVPIHFDISFPGIKCTELTLDAIDATGDEQNNVEHDFYKSPLDANGNMVFVGHYNYVERRLGPDGMPVGPMNYDERNDPKSPKFCGKCYIKPKHHNHGFDKAGGIVDHHLTVHHRDECCNTCEAVFEMYDRHRIPRPHIHEVEQCIYELSIANPGCNLRGTLNVNKVKGLFHFEPGNSTQFSPFGQHVHVFDRHLALHFDVSHIINHFEVGNKEVIRFSPSKMKFFPLDGAVFQVPQGHLAQREYRLSIVPAAYVYSEDVTESYEFTFQHHDSVFPKAAIQMKQPSLTFTYDFHPIKVTNVFRRPPFTQFLVRSCGIIGGMFVVLGLVHRLFEWGLEYGVGRGWITLVPKVPAPPRVAKRRPSSRPGSRPPSRANSRPSSRRPSRSPSPAPQGISGPQSHLPRAADKGSSDYLMSQLPPPPGQRGQTSPLYPEGTNYPSSTSPGSGLPSPNSPPDGPPAPSPYET